MNGERYPPPNPRFRKALCYGARLLMNEFQVAHKAMSAGFNQANAGEAGLRAQALQEIKIDKEIEDLNLHPISDTVPEDW